MAQTERKSFMRYFRENTPPKAYTRAKHPALERRSADGPHRPHIESICAHKMLGRTAPYGNGNSDTSCHAAVCFTASHAARCAEG